MHGNARLTPVGRLTMVLRIEAGRPVAHVAAEMGVSRPTAYKWWNRWLEGGDLEDFQGLPQLRGQDQTLGLLLTELLMESLGAHDDGGGDLTVRDLGKERGSVSVFLRRRFQRT